MKSLMFVIISLLFITKLLGQDTIEIKGEIISNLGTPLLGTNVVLYKTNIETITDACGQFKIKIPKNRKGYLVFSMISLPFYFNLKKIKSKDLEKGIVFRIMPFTEDKEISDRNYWKKYISVECNDLENKVTFKITKKNRNLPFLL
jgi:hypothetical protein